MGLRILIVDDSSIVRKSLTRTLGMTGYEFSSIEEAQNGQVALDIITAGPAFDLVFLDINMPVMNGIELLEALQEFGMLKSQKIIVISTEGSDFRLQRIWELGITSQLHKPVRPESLTQTVQHVLGDRA